MAKDVTFIIEEPPCDSLLKVWIDFLVKHTAKRANLDVSGTVRERTPEDTGYPVKNCLPSRLIEEAS